MAETDLEIFHLLEHDATHRFGSIPPARIATHVLAVTPGGDVPLRRAALEALDRRFASAEEQGPGWRLTPRLGKRVRAGRVTLQTELGQEYELHLQSFPELRGSCSCADYSHGALGLCKHLLFLLARGFDEEGNAATATAPAPLVRWDPIRPLTEPGEWHERIRVDGPAPASLRPLLGSFTPKLVDALLGLPEPEDRPALDPALRALLEREVARRETRPEARLGSAPLERALKKLRRPLFPYQREGVARFWSTGRLLLADDMGLGKTAQAIACSHALLHTGLTDRVLIVCPTALKGQWAREWALFSDEPITIVEGAPEARAKLYGARAKGALVVGYEQVLRDVDALQGFSAGLVVLDEAQRIKNWETRTAREVKRLRAPFRLVLSGTPLENRLTELASLLEFLDSDALMPSWRLPAWHAVRADGGREIVGARNLDVLRARLAPWMLRRLRRDVLGQLPSRTDTRVPVALTPEQQAEHDELDPPILQLLARSQSRPLSQPEFLRLMTLMAQQRVICNGLAQRDFTELWPTLEPTTRPTDAQLHGLFAPKLAELRELVSQLVVTQGRKVVVFSQWKRMLKLAAWATQDLLADAGRRAVFFTGDEGNKRRTQNVVDFHDDPTAAIFFATDAGGVGLNLQRAATACIHLELPWNPAVLEQRSARIHRHGQTSPVDVFALVSETGIEAKIAGLVGDKKALFDGLFDGGSDELRFERSGSFLATMRHLAPAKLPKASEEPLEEPPALLAAEPAPDALPPPPAAPPPGVTIERRPDGRVVIEADPQAAARLLEALDLLKALLGPIAGR